MDAPAIGNAMTAADAEVPLVLVVDDSITVRRVTQRLLKREGYRVALAADGLQALERLQEEKPAVVLSDIEMPRMDGFDLARNIRGDVRLRDLPIIMITSRIAEKHREHAKELGVDHYLGKPYSEDELMGLVRSYCPLPSKRLIGFAHDAVTRQRCGTCFGVVHDRLRVGLSQHHTRRCQHQRFGSPRCVDGLGIQLGQVGERSGG